MVREPVPDDVSRFILTSVPSVPYLEALLLMRNEPAMPWDSKRIAQRLYLSEKATADLLSELHAAGVTVLADNDAPAYCYEPATEELRQMIDRLAVAYAGNLVGVSTLIHSKTSKKAQRFADAFKWREDS